MCVKRPVFLTSLVVLVWLRDMNSRLILSIVLSLLALAAPPTSVQARDKNPGGVAYGPGALAFAAGFIRTEMPTVGRVTQAYDYRSILGKGDFIYIKMRNPEEVNLGAQYTIYRRMHSVFHPLSHRYLGDLISVVAVARVTNLDQDMATARIERAYSSVSPGDALMPFEPPPKPEAPSAEQVLPETPGTIVDFHVLRTLIGQNNIVFLDWGRDDGLRLGDVLDVYRVRPRVPPRQIGEVQIVALEDRTATAQVKRAVIPILLGDRILPRETARDIAHQLELPPRPGETPPPAPPRPIEELEPAGEPPPDGTTGAPPSEPPSATPPVKPTEPPVELQNVPPVNPTR